MRPSDMFKNREPCGHNTAISISVYDIDKFRKNWFPILLIIGAIACGDWKAITQEIGISPKRKFLIVSGEVKEIDVWYVAYDEDGNSGTAYVTEQGSSYMEWYSIDDIYDSYETAKGNL